MANYLNKKTDFNRCHRKKDGHSGKKSQFKPSYCRRLQSRFKKLECPFTESADETWIVELIFTPGEPRIKILQWLLSKFHLSIYNHLEPVYGGSESRLKAILHITSTLGLCRPSDLELIEGKTSAMKQMTFIDRLLDMVEVEDESTCMHSPSKYSRGISWPEEQYSADSSLVDSLPQQQPVSHIFPSHISILPPDINRSLDMCAADSNADRDDRQLCMDELTQRAALLTEDLGRQNGLLEHLKAEHTYGEVDHNTRHTNIRKLRLIMSELQQMMVNFSYCYDSHIQPWCNRDLPSLSSLGNKIYSVLHLLNTFTTMLGAMKVIKLSHEKLQCVIPTPLDQPMTEGGPEEVDRLYLTLDNLERTLNTSASILA